MTVTSSRRTTRSKSRSENVSNNVVPSVVDRTPIVLSQIDGKEIREHDIVWIKHEKCLDTPVIVENTLSDDRVLVRNLMDNKVIILNGRVHLTTNTSISDWTESTFVEYHCRIQIEKLTKAIPKTSPDQNTVKHERIDFCKDALRLILNDCRERDFSQLTSRLTKLTPKIQSIINDSVDFKSIVYELYWKIGRAARYVNKSNEESLSIAAKIFQDKCNIPFEMPRRTTTTTTTTTDITISICCVCNKMHRRNDVRKCQRCANIFHNKCHPNKTECPKCLAGNRPIDIVLTKLKKWWPAFIVHNHQVPADIYQKRKNEPGSVFVFTFRNFSYEQVQASNLLTFRTDDALQVKLLANNKDPNFETAIEFAEKLCLGMRSRQELDS